jgi:hypothetical protein
MARAGDIDQAFGATTLSYFGATVGFLLLPYAKSFEFLGTKMDFNLAEKQNVLSLKLDDLRKLLRQSREPDEAPTPEPQPIRLKAKLPKLVSKVQKGNKLGIQSLESAAGPSKALFEALTDEGARKPGPPSPGPVDPLTFAVNAMKMGSIDDDPWKGQFGGAATQNGRKLSATVVPAPGDPDFFLVSLRVESMDTARTLKDSVCFFLHDSFPQYKVLKRVMDGAATLELKSWGAFTVGVLADEGATELELDLAADPSFPRKFRSR